MMQVENSLINVTLYVILKLDCHSRIALVACDILDHEKCSNLICCPSEAFKGELQRENESISYERASKMLENDMCISLESVKSLSSY